MSSVAPEKKSKVRETHRMAIVHFQKWLAQNPHATHGERFKKFDESVDLAAKVREAERAKHAGS